MTSAGLQSSEDSSPFGQLATVSGLREELTRRQRVILGLLTLVAGVTRLAAIAKGPWDWDEVLFCLAVQHYDVAEHRPHPPGFPLHVLLGKIARLFAPSDFTALQAVNVLAGVAIVPVLFWLARGFRFRFETSAAIAFLFAFLPNVWFYGGTAFSDVPAMVFFLAAAAAFLNAGDSTRPFLIASALAGCAMLYRPQEAMVLGFPWLLAVSRLIRAKNRRALAWGVVTTIVIVSIGYGAAIGLTGFDRYLNVVKGHAANVRATDSLGSPGRPPLSEAVWILLDPYDAGKVSILVNLLAAAGIVLGVRRRVAQILLTFVPVFVFTLIATHPAGSSRMSLAFIAGIVLLAAEGAMIAERWWPRAGQVFAGVLFALILGRFVTWTYPAFRLPGTTNPPQVQAMLWLRQHVDGRVPIVSDHSIDPWVRYYLADRATVRFEDVFSKPLGRDLGESWFVAVGRPGARNAIRFERARDRAWNIVTQRGFEAFVQPFSGIARFGEGWYMAEENGVEHWRWAAQTSSMELPPMRGRRAITMALTVPTEVLHAVELEFVFNGALVRTVPVATRDATVRIFVEPRAGQTNVLKVVSSKAFVPAKLGNSDDMRELAWMLRSWQIDPAPALAPPVPATPQEPRLRRAG